MRLCTEDVVAMNVPIGPINGKAAVRDFFAKFGKGMTDKRYDVHRILADGASAVVEGVENYVKDGKQVSLPYMSTFLFRGRPDQRVARLLRPADRAQASSACRSTARGRRRKPRRAADPRDGRGRAPAALVRPRSPGTRRLRPQGPARRARGASPRPPHRAVRGRQHVDLRRMPRRMCGRPLQACNDSASRKGDRVLAWLPTGRAMVLTWFAANYLGAVFVPLNTAYRGDVLNHVVNAATGRVMVAHYSLVPRLDGLALSHLRQVIVRRRRRAGARVRISSCSARIRAARRSRDAGRQRRNRPLGHPVDHLHLGHDRAVKGVLSPYLQLHTTARSVYGYMRRRRGDPRQPADVPRRRHELRVLRADRAAAASTSSTASAPTSSGTRCGTATARRPRGLIGVMAAFLAKPAPRPDDARQSAALPHDVPGQRGRRVAFAAALRLRLPAPAST